MKTIFVAILLLATITTLIESATIMSREDKVSCLAKSLDKVKSEPDADLKEKISSVLSSVKSIGEIDRALSDAQKQKIIKNYFTGSCAPLKDIFD